MQWLNERIRGHGDRKALAVGVRVATYADLHGEVRRMTAFLDANGVGAGQVVVIRSDYSIAAIALFLALAARKAIVVPVTSAVEEEARDRIHISGADGVVTFDGDRPRLERRDQPVHERVKVLREVGAAGLILFSSGSTGEPKAMLHDLDRLAEVYAGRRPKMLTVLLFLMFDHIGGLNTLLNALSMGAFVVTPPDRTPEAVAGLIERHRVHLLPASPTFLNLLLMSGCADRHDLSSLRMISYGTETMPQALVVRLKKRFPRARLLQTYGTSETGIARTASRASASLFMKFDDPNLEVRVVDGELWLRSGTQMLGYLNASMDRFTEDGWFMTGDLVEESGDGYLRIVGRNTDVINVGGEKVLPTEVEAAILELEEVADCLAYAHPNPITGQSVAVQAVVRDGVDKAEAKRLIRRHCAERLDRYKNPARIQLVESIAASGRFKKRRRGVP